MPAQIHETPAEQGREHLVPPGKNRLLDAVWVTQQVAAKHGIQPIMVGGILPRLLRPLDDPNPTEIASIDWETRTLTLRNPANPDILRHTRTRRGKERTTVVDVDFISTPQEGTAWEDAYQNFEQRASQFVEALDHREAKERQGSPDGHFPKLSPESYFYRSTLHEGRKPRTELVSNIIVTPPTAEHPDPRGVPHFAIDRAEAAVSWESIAPWKITFEGDLQDYSFYAFNPYSMWYRYFVRGFGDLKRKDQSKILGNDSPFRVLAMDFANRYQQHLAESGQNGEEAFHAMYQGWETFRYRAQHGDIVTQAKRRGFNLWWDSGAGDLISQSRLLGKLDRLASGVRRR